ncbi:MAG: glycerophosphodiester phosphodiesterase [Ruminococcaceae bacterium]|nr:glycerophosphodiester phosphodiesterase [Oscillospiraceae bacterium]
MTVVIGAAVFALSVIILIYLFLISPRVSAPADMELLKGAYAHRGLWNERYPENSLPALKRAMENGFGIEIDIQLSKDKQIVVFHDDDLKRMCGVSKKVAELTLAELKALRLKETAETIPTLSEVLRLVHGKVPLLIEIKGERADDRLCRGASLLLDRYNGAFCIQSFSPLIVRWFKRYRPNYARGQLVTKITSHTRKGSKTVNFLLTHMLTNFLSRPDFISINGHLRKRLGFLICTKLLHAEGFAWTIRNQKDFDICRKSGLSIIFEKFIPKG